MTIIDCQLVGMKRDEIQVINVLYSSAESEVTQVLYIWPMNSTKLYTPFTTYDHAYDGR